MFLHDQLTKPCRVVTSFFFATVTAGEIVFPDEDTKLLGR